jgi:predicted AlkP superfamily pyrophosphatase or phosphodiesterase
MKKLMLAVLAAGILFAGTPKKPKLVLFIVVDQCRYDYLTKFRKEFNGGFDRLLKSGANFTRAEDHFFPTLTAVGHATLLTGAMPSATGIIGNDWFDRQAGKRVTSVSDDATQLIGGDKAKGASPIRLLVPTVGDELKKANGGRPRVLGISVKDRSAILLAGKKPDGAYWFDEKSGNFVTSSYYRPALPDWAQAFNNSHPADRYLGATWLSHRIPDRGRKLYKAIEWSPFGNELVEALAERAIQGEALGRREDTDLLALSFSSTDYVGHDYGPDSPEVHETLLRTDRLLEKLFQAVDREVGLSSVLVVMTSDHGIPPLAKVNHARKMPGGHRPLAAVSDWIRMALAAKYGPGKWVTGCWDLLIYLNRDLIAQKKLDVAEVNRAAAEALRRMPHIARAYTREELMDNRAVRDETGRRVKDGFNAAQGADIVFLPEPYWVFSDLNTTHGTTYDYDTHVPLIFMGSGIRAGSYDSLAPTNDIAPTLAEILGVAVPKGSVGRVLSEMFTQ